LVYGTGVELSPLLLRPFIGLLYQRWMIDGDDCGAVSRMNEWQGKTDVLGGNLSQRRSVHYISLIT
jgi:hypothetical protein